MSDLNRLRELAALFRPLPTATAVVEETTPNALSSLDGIRSVVEDAMADLEDKLGHDGTLENLLDKNGLSGKIFIAHLASGIKEYKKETLRILNDIEKMLVDIEMEAATKPTDDDIKAHDAIFARHGK